jgi:NAD(P)-dependent dehydrogenase (short-subunit alcohol dehydrogenase family)
MSLIAGVTANSVHPGAVATDLWRNLPKTVKVPFIFIAKFFFKVCDEDRITLTAFI